MNYVIFHELCNWMQFKVNDAKSHHQGLCLVVRPQVPNFDPGQG